ncbi:MAG: hypothetical protein NTW54_07555 [Bacteroidetes bacterium]|nr:hypothetical protein [Bacteroidota bacterium]
MRKYLLVLFIAFCLIGLPVLAQERSDKTAIPYDSVAITGITIERLDNTLSKPPVTLENLEINGYYRFIANYRHLNDAYSHLENNINNIFIGDDSQIPQLMLNIKGYASSRTFFGTDLFLWSPMTGVGEKENVKGLNLGVSLFGNFSTNYGNYSIRAGGINWYSLSPFTFQTAKGYNRYSLFERNPWDPNTAKVDSRYSDFYASGAINQDQRWGNQAFQGLILEGEQLPKNFSLSVMYGKTQLDGGLSPIPNNSFGGKILKTYSKNNNTIAFNTFNNKSFLDSLGKNSAGFNIATIELKQQLNRFKIYAEIGAGKRFSSNIQGNWGEAISVKVSNAIAEKFPTELHIYRISPDVLNNNAIFINSSIQQTTQLSPAQTQPVLLAVSSAVLPIGQLSNNRQGVELNSQVNTGKIKTSIGYSNAVELEKLSPKITYSHAFNTLALSRFWRWDFPSEVGPYKNLSKIYRSVYETVYITELDSNNLPLYKKHFNTIEINAKYNTTLANRAFYVFYLGSFNSVQNEFSPLLKLSEKALLRAYYHQLEGYLKLNPRLVWTNYVSYERIIANYKTQTDNVTRRPKNQVGVSVASGLDIELSKGVGLYMRERWMKYEDTSFRNDHYSGFETTVELKMFF